MFYICTKLCRSISYGFRVTDLNSRVDARVVTIYKGAQFRKTVDGVMVLNLCTSPDDALYLYQVSRKYLIRVSELLRGCCLNIETFRGA